MDIDIMAKTTVYKSSWVADGFDVLFSVIYLLEKHRDLCVPLLKVSNTGISTLSEVIIYWRHNVENKKAKVSDYFIEFPGGEKVFKTSMEACLNNKHRFIIIPLGISFSSGNGGHFNIILIDKKTKTVERFEPYGVESLDESKIMKKLENILKKFVFSDYKILSGNKLFPKRGLQFIEEKAIEVGKGTALDLDSDPIGYCIAWSIYYVDMRLSNREISSKQLIELLIKNLSKYHHSLRTFIRNYSTHLVKEKTKFLVKINKDLNKKVTRRSSQIFSKDIEEKLTKYFLNKIKKK
jgi:hypothetical protein